MRISLRVDYALRAMAQLAAATNEEPVKTHEIATAQAIPVQILPGIFSQLRAAHLVVSQRGARGGYVLARPAGEISLADVIRAIEGPLASVHDESLGSLTYDGPARPLTDVWMALRTSLRNVLEAVTLEHLIDGQLPRHISAMAEQYRSDPRH